MNSHEAFSKQYYLNIIRSGFITQIDIPTSYLLDMDIINLMKTYNWRIINANPINLWTKIVKNSYIRD